jgi:gamma-glutamylaminecyclotransferase
MPDHFVFCYGSLMKGEYNHRFLEHARFVGTGVTHPIFELVDFGAYSAMVIGGMTAIHGEVYAVDDGTLERLDRLEGHPSYYERTRIILQDSLEVWVYLMRDEIVGARPRIASGIWKKKKRAWIPMLHPEDANTVELPPNYMSDVAFLFS